MRPIRALAMVVVTALATIAIGFASRAPYHPPGADQAELRLSWRLRGEKLQSCRQRSEEELKALPAHMRTPQVCTGHLISYRLVVAVDGAADTLVFAPAGAKGDRPIFVLHDVALKPGRHDVEIDFAPVEKVTGSKRKLLRFRGALNARPGHVALITLTPDATALRVVN